MMWYDVVDQKSTNSIDWIDIVTELIEPTDLANHNITHHTVPRCFDALWVTTQTLERYQRCSFNPADNSAERETQSWFQEVSKLKAKYESLQRTQRHLLGEDLGPLSLKELQNLEKQLEGALIQARQRKTQIMMEQMEELRRKERQLGDMNKQLKIRVSLEMSTLEAEGQGLRTTLPCPWNGSVPVGTAGFTLQVPSSDQVEIEPEPVLQIGYQHYNIGEGSSAPRSMTVDQSNFFQDWTL
ncbi:Agamous-like MADS-box protein mads3 [Orobanche minor]